MRARIISAFIGLLVLAVVLVGYNTVVLNIAISVVSAIGVSELLKAYGYNKTHKSLNIAGITFAALIPFFQTEWYVLPAKHLVFAYIIVLFVILLKNNSKLRFEEVAVAFMMSLAIPLSLTSLLYVKYAYRDLGYYSIFYLLLALGAAWLADSGAYFTGRFLGKHKLAPNISPKKTIEGSVGGIIVNTICFCLLGLAFTAITGIQVNYLNLALLGFLSAPVGMVGDLVFSVIKRQNSVKDFGTIMPGHGGVLDRFDSVVLTAPFLMFMLEYLPPICR